MKMNWYDLSKYRNQLYGLSMLWIVIFHVWESFKDLMDEKWSIIYIIRSGNYGVDLFLFLSGISMYFAIQKFVDGQGNIDIFSFYKKRIAKILKVYILFCVPYYIVIHLILQKDINLFFKQLFFCRDRVSSFWFLLCIVICYLLYPIMFKWMKHNNKKYIWCFLATYILCLFLLCTYKIEFYNRYEILLSRIPIFIIGTVCGRKVYNKEEIKSYRILFAVILLILKNPFFYIMKFVPFWDVYDVILKRFYGSLIAVCAIIFLILILKYLENTKIFKLLDFLGTYTLETYVFHIAYRVILLKLPFIKVDSLIDVSLFLIFYTISSFVFAYILSLILNRGKVNFRHERIK